MRNELNGGSPEATKLEMETVDWSQRRRGRSPSSMVLMVRWLGQRWSRAAGPSMTSWRRRLERAPELLWARSHFRRLAARKRLG
uniref:Uncharacterized protein n=1 Tax=Oryza punctata TaxID=4537 RepID=A0A0E0LYR9_ORYPU